MEAQSSGSQLTSRQRWLLVVTGAALGAFIGPMGFWLQGLEATERLRERSGSAAGPPLRWSAAFDAVGTSPTQLGFMLLACLATAVLMPLLLRWLERQAGRPAGAFYLRAAIAGVAFGTAATIVTTMALFIVFLVVGVLYPDAGGRGASAGETAAGLVAGTGVFAPIAGLAAPFLFRTWILLFGVPFGLLFGVLVRRLARGG